MYIEILSKNKNFSSIQPNNEDKIRQIREYLGGSIPPSYEKYLVEIGDGGTPNFDIMGTGAMENDAALIVKNELYHRDDEHLPKGYILISDIGNEIAWYLDLGSRQNDGECQVVGWIGGLSKQQQPLWLKKQETYSTFEEFFRKRVVQN